MFVVEAEVVVDVKFGGVDDLAGVQGEMFDDMIDGAEDRRVVSLNVDALDQAFGFEAFDDPAGCFDRVTESGGNLFCR